MVALEARALANRKQICTLHLILPRFFSVVAELLISDNFFCHHFTYTQPDDAIRIVILSSGIVMNTLDTFN